MGVLSSTGFVEAQSGTINLPAGSDRILVGRIFYHETTDQNTSPTYGGSTASGEVGDFVTDGTEGGMEMHYWLDADLPANGDNTFDIGTTGLGAPGFGCVVLDGRNQAGPDDFADISNHGGGDGATIGSTLTAAADDSDAVGCAEANDGSQTYTPGTGQTEEFDADIGGAVWQGTASYETGLASGSQNHEYTLSSAKNQSFKAAIWQPSTGGSTGGGGTGLPIGVAHYHLNQLRK